MVRLTVFTLLSALLWSVASAYPQAVLRPDANKPDLSTEPIPFPDVTGQEVLNITRPDVPAQAELKRDAKTGATGIDPKTGLPFAPKGATLVQYKGCKSRAYSIPMFVNKNYPITGSSDASVAWIVQHGSARNFDNYFSSVYDIVHDEGVVIAPNFYANTDTGNKAKWYQPKKNLAWNNNDWFNGADAVAPAGAGLCSSFDVYDSLVELLADRTKFPNLRTVYAVGHSAGASMLAKYGMLKPYTNFRFVLANSPSMPYFTDARPDTPTNCGNFTSWGYGFGGEKPRYVKRLVPRFQKNGVGYFYNWISQDVTHMTGTLDTYRADPTGDQSCPVQAQGGRNRRDRGYAWWAYLNLLGGTTTDVSQFYGYEAFKDQGVTSLNPPEFGARHCVVKDVAHNNVAMFASACGRAALTGAAELPPGPGPIRPA
ncbi:hypothetical protein EX895_004207 [Sporisorium graminicola]|uniref:AB hydrolase-1 domain-containing protein n=1 Tax=Sporisorium graminicola TaxID=280036 RepID=A0A4V6ETJ9_9BASI|nr:hypothetical protein EX895_004207 [Sporisorium graminicola]TKY86919.1 hypothetical protein EX895_004207 [Sporisorium graminicola]